MFFNNLNTKKNGLFVQLPTDRWEKNRDVIEGSDAVKSKATTYLPNDFCGLLGEEAKRAYDSYWQRALFIPLARTSLLGCLGAIFRKPIQHNLDTIPEMSYMLEDADSMGNSIHQLSQCGAFETAVVSRIGFLSDFPIVPEGLSAAETKKYKAFISVYVAENILCWQYKRFDGIWKLAYLKLSEVDEDGNCCYRELFLDERGKYYQVFTDAKNTSITIYPRQANGERFDHIPFSLCNTLDNSFDLQPAIVNGWVDINIKHYQVSADKYQNYHYYGVPTLFIMANFADEASAQKFTSSGALTLGSGSGALLPMGSTVQLVEVKPANALVEELKSLEDQIILLGGRFVLKGIPNQTAEAAIIQEGSSQATLSLLVRNLSEAIESALEDCARFMGVDPEKVMFKLNESFFDEKPEAQIMQVMNEFVKEGYIAKEQVREYLRRTGLINNDISDEILDQMVEQYITAIAPLTESKPAENLQDT